MPPTHLPIDSGVKTAQCDFTTR